MQQERIDAMSALMVQVRKAQQDIGEVLVASLADAAKELGSVEALVHGRPGSWEADIVRRMALAGHYVRVTNLDESVVRGLSVLFIEMGEAREDGGDILSQAMGQAVNELGGLKEFAGDSQWYWDLVNIGCQYSRYPFPVK